jgi:hypothetical protein
MYRSIGISLQPVHKMIITDSAPGRPLLEEAEAFRSHRRTCVPVASGIDAPGLDEEIQCILWPVCRSENDQPIDPFDRTVE